jgi:hypothetical protein
MSKFLDHDNCKSHIQTIIKTAQKELIFLTYNLDINENYQNWIKRKIEKDNINVTILYNPKTKIKSDVINWIKDVNQIKLLQNKTNHSKCYLNEHSVVITSMNLSKASEENNFEMGVFFNIEEDERNYNEIKQEVDYFILNSASVKTKDNFVENFDSSTNLNSKAKFRIDSLSKRIKAYAYEKRIKVKDILTDEQIFKLASLEVINISNIKKVIKNKIKLNDFLDLILDELNYLDTYSFGKIIDTKLGDDYNYSTVQFFDIEKKTTEWYNTTELALPLKNSYVAVRLNESKGNLWFNYYLNIDKPVDSFFYRKKDKEIERFTSSQIADLIDTKSIEFNDFLIENGYMEKIGKNYFITEKGIKQDGKQMSGRYGKYVIWPKSILNSFN